MLGISPREGSRPEDVSQTGDRSCQSLFHTLWISGDKLLGDEEAVFEMVGVASLCTLSNVKIFGNHRCCGPASWSAILVPRAENGAKMKSPR